jgi:glucose/arabinose dehydrogenase
MLTASVRAYYLRVFRLAICLVIVLIAAGCQKDNPAPPSPGPGGGVGETITGRERLGWDQPAPSTAELASYRYAVYVDNVRGEMSEITCGSSAGASGYQCSGRLPAMSTGAHRIELATFVMSGDNPLESAKSPALQVTVTGATPPAESTQLQDGETLATSDGVQLEARLVADGLDDPSDMTIAPDGRLFIAQRSGVVVLDRDAHAALTGTGKILAIALDPDFARTRQIFIVEAVLQDGGFTFRTSRYRELGGQLVERLVVLPELPASNDPAATLRFGPDGKLYAAFDDGGSADAAAKLSEWNGKVLRLEKDGRTPADQPSASPVLVTALKSPRGLAWTPDGLTLWLAEFGVDGIERLRAIAMTSERPRRVGQRASYAIPDRVGLGSMAVHTGAGLPRFEGDLLIAAREAGYLLRVRFEQEDRRRVVTTERLFENRIGPVHAVTIAADGSLYAATARQLWRLIPRQ